MSTEFVGIELELMGADGVRRDLEQLDRLLNSFRGKKKFDMGLNEARTQVVAFKGELEKLKREYSSIIADNKKVISNSKDSAKALTDSYKKGLISLKEYREEFHRLATQSREAASSNKEMNAEIDATRQKMWSAQQAVREFGQASREAGRTFKETFNMISSRVAHIGSAMQSFGNAMTQLTSPFRRLTSGVLMGAGFKVFNSFSEGFERGFTRYDTMKKYPKIMAAFGYSAAQAEESIKALDLSVRGLPTGLDEMVDLAQRFTATTGDIEKGTKLAIAANNAFLASMSTDTQKYQGMMQLQDVLGGKDMNAREWNSLVSSMTPAIVKMGESLGYTSDNMGEWIQKVRDGKVSNEDFIDTLIKIGNEGGVLEAMAQESKNTWQAFFANVGNAASRMTAGIIQAFDEISQSLTGKDVNQLFADTIIPGIDNTTKSIKEWIKAHPEEITKFFKDLSKIQIGNFIRGYAKGLEWMIGLVEKLGTALGKHPHLMGFLGGFFGVGGILGRMSTIAGGLLKGTRHIWAAIGAGGSWLLKGKLGKLGIFGRIASIFGSKKSLKDAGDAAKEIPTISNTFKSAFSSLEGLIKASGAILLVSGTGFVAFKSAKSILQDLKDMTDLINGGGWDNVGYVGAGLITAIGTFTEIFNAIGTALGPEGLLGVAIASAASVLVSGSFAADMWLIKSGLQNVRNTILEFDKIGEAITNMKGLAGINTGEGSKLQASVDAIRGIVRTLSGGGGGPIDRGQLGGGIPLFTSLKTNSLANISSAIEQLKNVVTQFNQLGAMQIVNNPETVIESIKKACNQMQGIRGPKNIDKHAQKVANALIQIRRMAYHINKLAGTDVNVDGFGNFVEQIRNALEDFKSLSGELMLDIEVKLSPLFGSSVNSVKTNIKNAKRDIEKLKTPIAFNIPVTVTFSVTSNFASALNTIVGQRQRLRNAASNNDPGFIGPPRGPAKGGLIYRAHGGGIPWKRRGTDTVPAMLTPGEYVHNKRAVSAFGIDFMRKVNNLDMKGAMNELMHRAGHMANINRGTNITNNNYNNQKVVINNSNAGAGYTFRTASRFVGAF